VATEPNREQADVAARRRERLQAFMTSGGAAWSLVAVLAVVATVLSPDFRTTTNLSNVSRQAIVLSLVSLGQFVVVVTAGVDLSVGVVVRISALATAMTIAGADSRTIAGLLVALVVGMAVGASNGVVVIGLRVPPFIATFGTFTVLQGVSLLVASTPKGRTSPILERFWTMKIGPFFGVVVFTALVWLIVWFALEQTRWGRHIYAVGSDSEVAESSGIRVEWIRFSAYVVAGFLAAIGGILTATRAGIGDPNAGLGLEFEALAAVVIGGGSLSGGRGKVIGVLGGSILLSGIGNVFNLLDVAVWNQQLLKGTLILAGAAMYVGQGGSGVARQAA